MKKKPTVQPVWTQLRQRIYQCAIDDQMWAINLVLLVFAAFVFGIILSNSNFHDPRFFFNGWMHVGGLILTIAAISIAAISFKPYVRRSLQLAVLCSLIFHVLLAYQLGSAYLELKRIERKEASRDSKTTKKRVYRDFLTPMPDKKKVEREFEKPVETKTPEVEKDPSPREEKPQEIEPPQRDTEETPAPKPELKPSPVPLERQETSAPRRAKTQSKLSKQTKQADPQPQRPIAAPARELRRPRMAQLNTKSPTVEKREQTVQPPRQQQQPRLQEQPRVVKSLPRRQPQQNIQPRQETTPQRIARNTPLPKVVPLERQAQQVEPRPVQPQPVTKSLQKPATAVTKNTTPLPQTSRRPLEPTPEKTVNQVNSKVARQQPSEALPELARNEPTRAVRRPNSVTIAESAIPAPQKVPSRQPVPNKTPAPRPEKIARTNAPAPAPQATPVEVRQPSPRAISAQTPQRTESNTTPQPVSAPSVTPTRQTAVAQVEPAQPVTTPAVSQPTPNAQPTLTAQPTKSQPRTTASQVTAAQTPPSPAVEVTPRTSVQATRSERSPATAEPKVTQAARNVQRSASQSTQANTAQQTIATPQQSNPSEPTARSLVANQAATPRQTKTTAEPTPARLPTDSVAASRSQAVKAQQANAPKQVSQQNGPTVATATATPVERQHVETSISTQATSVAQSPKAANAPSTGSTPQPKSTTVARRSSASPSRTNAQSVASDVPRSVKDAQVAQAASRPSQSSELPSLQPDLPATDRPRQTQQASAVASSPQAVEAPALTQSTDQNKPVARPADSALSKAETGFVGSGRSSNADVQQPATPKNTAKIASAAAIRNAASQTEAGPDISPSAPATLARSRTTAQQQASSLVATNVPTATVPGAKKTTDLNATAGASLAKQNANAPTASISVSVGEVPVETGVNQIVANTGQGRAAGGGQPEITLTPNSKSPARAKAGGATIAAVDANVPSPEASTPREQGGGAPGPQSTELARGAEQLPSNQAGKATAASDIQELAKVTATVQATKRQANDSKSPQLAAEISPAGLPTRQKSLSQLAVAQVATEGAAGAPANNLNTESTVQSADLEVAKAELNTSTSTLRDLLAEEEEDEEERKRRAQAAALAARQQSEASRTKPNVESASRSATITRSAPSARAVAAAVEAAPQGASSPSANSQSPALAAAAMKADPKQSASISSVAGSPGTKATELAQLPVEVVATGAAGRPSSATAQPKLSAAKVSSPSTARQSAPSAAQIAESAISELPSSTFTASKSSVAAIKAASGATEAGRAAVAQGPAIRSADNRAAETPASAAGVQASQIAKVETADTLPGINVGGGTAQPATERGRAMAAVVQSSAEQIAAAPTLAASNSNPQSDSQAMSPTSVASMSVEKASTEAVSAPETMSIEESESLAGSPERTSNMAPATTVDQPAPTVSMEVAATSSSRDSSTAILPETAIQIANSPQQFVSAEIPSGHRGLRLNDTSADSDRPAPSDASLIVRQNATEGVGGLEQQISVDVGIVDRRAIADSAVPKNEIERFLQKKDSGQPKLSGTARVINPVFARRKERLKNQREQAKTGALTKDIQAIELGIDFLARHQAQDGSWSLKNYAQGRTGYENEKSILESKTAATGLSLLAFLGHGYDHYDEKYQLQVSKALEYLISRQKASGNLYITSDNQSNQIAQLYSHGIATIALCEAYGMTKDPKVGQAAQRAMNFIISAQHKERGGWRYTPGYMSDLSVSAWQLAALRTGELTGLSVPGEVYQRVEKFLEKSSGGGPRSGYFVYNPYAADTQKQRHGRSPSTVMTSVGLYMRLLQGWRNDAPNIHNGADHLLANLPELGIGRRPALTGTLENPLRDTYYWYYATQVMYSVGGEYEAKWEERIKPLLTDTQVRKGRFAGSWDPVSPVPDKWGRQAGRIYVTTLNLLSLEAKYRKLYSFGSKE